MLRRQLGVLDADEASPVHARDRPLESQAGRQVQRHVEGLSLRPAQIAALIEQPLDVVDDRLEHDPAELARRQLAAEPLDVPAFLE